MKRAVRTFLTAGVVLALVALAGLFFAYRAATRLVEAQIRASLGPEAKIRSLDLSWNGAGVTDLTVPAPAGSGAAHMLKAGTIWLRPSVKSLFGPTLTVSSITIDRGYLLIRRTGQGLVFPLPQGTSGASPSRSIQIERLEIPGATIDWSDTTVSPPVRLRLEPVNITVTGIRLPVSGPVNLSVEGEIAGQSPARLSLTGWTNPHSLDSDIRVRVIGVDLVPLQPYFLGPKDAHLAAGRLDLSMESVVKAGQLRAPGQLTLTGLRFAPSAGLLQTFVGVPRDAMLKFLETNKRLDVAFVVEGPVGSPEFKIEEALSRRIALAMADKLGVPVKEIGKGLIGAGAKGAEAVKKQGEALGKTLKGIFK